MIPILTDGSRNQKLAKTMSIYKNAHIMTFALPRVVTCPCAGACKDICYANRGNLNTHTNKHGQNYRYEMSLKDEFVTIMNGELAKLTCYVKPYVRLHTVGDIYSRDYFAKWIQIANDNPNVIIYGYTKSISIVKSFGKLPKNLIIAYSYGGTEDNLIDPKKDRHVIIIPSNAKIPTGYYDGSHDDFTILKHKKVVLRYHGMRNENKVDFDALTKNIVKIEL